MRFADVIVDISLEKLDQTFQYKIPEELSDGVKAGSRVLVPFGNGNRQLTGYVLDVSDTPAFDVAKTKNILSVVTGAVTLEQTEILLAYWMKEHFGGTMNDALKTVLPIKRTVREEKNKTLRLTATKEEYTRYLEKIKENARYRSRVRLLELLFGTKTLGYSDAVQKHGIGAGVIETLRKDGILEIQEEIRYRNTANGIQSKKRPELNEEQRAAVETVWNDYEKGIRKNYLLFGVTGSGKTEVYLELLERVIAAGKQAIVLIPEISLTVQTVQRFYDRFGDRVSVIHSRLSEGERYDQYVRAGKGEIDVMIGPRSALFFPMERLGLIIIDEEQETAYKSEQVPKYHARETAQYLAQLTGSALLLGSATPSLESYFGTGNGEYELLRLHKRAKNATMPKVTIVDLRDELAAGNRSIFSRELSARIKERLAKGEQVMLFLNRRGYAGAVSCRSCGAVIKCPHCDVSLTFHKGEEKLLCHYCGYEIKKPPVCPACASKYIGLFGTGTQKVEEAVLKEFPGAAVLRMDADTTKNKGGHEKIIEAFSKGEAQILIGTQMIVKGHDFPKVTLVGILAADLSLHAGDFRAAERTFCLLAQAAGRAGRDKLLGEVIIQTYQPEHYSITFAATEDYEGFYRQEIAYRRLLNYPPVSHLLAVLVQSEQEAAAKEAAGCIAAAVRGQISKEDGPDAVNGPVPAGLGKLKDVFRYLIYVKSKSYERLMELHAAAQKEKDVVKQRFSVRVLFDFDPHNGY